MTFKSSITYYSVGRHTWGLQLVAMATLPTHTTINSHYILFSDDSNKYNWMAMHRRIRRTIELHRRSRDPDSWIHSIADSLNFIGLIEKRCIQFTYFNDDKSTTFERTADIDERTADDGTQGNGILEPWQHLNTTVQSYLLLNNIMLILQGE